MRQSEETSKVQYFKSIKQKNNDLATKEYRQKEVLLKSKPVAVFVELTQGCNLCCPMCRDEVIPVRNRSMTDATFRVVSETLFPTAELVDLRGWGESLILKNFLDRLEQTLRFGVVVRVVTNLSFERKDVLDCLMANDCIIDVSLDTAKVEHLSAVRTGTDLRLVSENLKRLTSNLGMRDRLTVLVTVQDRVVSDLPHLVRFLGAHGVKNVRLFSVTSEQTSDAQLDQRSSKLDTAISEVSKVADEQGMRVTAGTKIGGMPENAVSHPTCTHPWKYCNVAYDGSVGFCDHLIGPGNLQYFVGNINDQDFSSIWNSSDMVGLRNEHLLKRRPSSPKFAHCSWCYKNKYIDFENMFDPNLSASIKHI